MPLPSLPLWLLQAGAALPTQPVDSAALALHLGRLRGAALDSAVVKSPLPGGVAAVSRWLFGLPSWVQLSALAIGVLAALGLAFVLWRRRRAIWAAIRARSRAWQIAYAAVAAAVVLAAAGAGTAGWNYTQHDNDFCVSCHVMTPAFQRFQTSEHRKLSCHDCHQQSIFVSARQVFYWVADRPDKIPTHAPVPTRICAECHVQRDADSSWKRIVATAGHRVHLFSDSSALKGKVECVTCHGQEVHRFAPVNQSCGQSGCHDQGDTKIRLGKMASQTQMHCTGCHQFTRAVVEAVPVDSARAAMSPGQRQCLGCHSMQTRLADFDPRREPHQAACGACHNPHTQETPRQAFRSCTTAGCHVGVDTIVPMHRGLPARVVGDCARCHQAHEWKAKAGTCVDCHADVLRGGGARATGRSPHRTATGSPITAPLAEPIAPRGPAPYSPHGAPAGPSGDDAAVRAAGLPFAAPLGAALPPAIQPVAQPPVQRTASAPAPRRKFSHPIHRDVACTSCHASEQRHGETLVRSARDCASCHHRADRATSCTGCHEPGQPAPPAAVPVSMTLAAGAPARARTLPFDHARHRAVACRDCHTGGVTLAVSRTCASCHAEHRTPIASCVSCHAGNVQGAHRREAHDGCAGSACHVGAATAVLQPTRTVCLVCHQDRSDHKPGRECADCHRVTWHAASEPRS